MKSNYLPRSERRPDCCAPDGAGRLACWLTAGRQAMGRHLFAAALIVSCAGHGAVMAPSGMRLPVPNAPPPQEITVLWEQEPPPLLPDIRQMGQEQHIAAEHPPQEQPLSESPLVTDAGDTLPRQAAEPLALSPDTAMLRYQDMVKRRIEQARFYPAWARKQGVRGSVQIEFTVRADGHSHDIQIRNSSGSSVLDNAALAVVTRAGPFPPFPPELGRTAVRMDVRVVFARSDH